MSTEDTAGRPPLTKEENDAIWERQNFVMGCIEMERITDEIVVPYFSYISRFFKAHYPTAELTLMDCESPLDEQLYNLGVRFSFPFNDNEAAFTIVADPSDSTFSFIIEGASAEPRNAEFKFQETIPKNLDTFLAPQLAELFPQVNYVAKESGEDAFEQHEGPFRVQYDDHGNVSDVATTKTLPEAANMASTFAKMFNNEKGITILNAQGEVIC